MRVKVAGNDSPPVSHPFGNGKRLAAGRGAHVVNNAAAFGRSRHAAELRGTVLHMEIAFRKAGKQSDVTCFLNGNTVGNDVRSIGFDTDGLQQFRQLLRR